MRSGFTDNSFDFFGEKSMLALSILCLCMHTMYKQTISMHKQDGIMSSSYDEELMKCNNQSGHCFGFQQATKVFVLPCENTLGVIRFLKLY